jgi:hypothetical protein
MGLSSRFWDQNLSAPRVRQAPAIRFAAAFRFTSLFVFSDAKMSALAGKMRD